MALRINQNLLALKALGNLNRSSNRFEKSVGKLSSGLRINSASDDPAGLAISEKLRARITGLERAFLNAQDGVSLVQTAEGALSNTQDIMQRIRELALQSANGTLTSLDRASIHQESRQLISQINDIANSTQFNTKKLINGSQSAQVSLSSNLATAIVSSNSNASGNYSVHLQTLQAGVSQVQSTHLLTDKTGNAVQGTTKLSDLTQFQGTNGEPLLGASSTITLNAGAKTAQININQNQSLDDLASSLERALTQDLGLSGSSVSVVKDSAGTAARLEIISGTTGEDGEISVVASEALSTALGFSTTRAAQNARVSATITDQMGNSRTVTADGNRINEVVEGISLQINSQAMQAAGTNGMNLKMQVKAGSLNLQVGASEGQTMSLSIGDMSALALGIDSIDLSTPEKAAKALRKIDAAMNKLGSEVGRMGSFQNRLGYTMTNLENTAVNLTAAEARIRDVDMAAEVIEYTRNQILMQAGTAMLAQANSVMGNVLTLLGK